MTLSYSQKLILNGETSGMGSVALEEQPVDFCMCFHQLYSLSTETG